PEGVNLSDVWTDLSPVRHKKFKRRGANELPLKMIDRILDLSTVEGDTVIDPFGGSGTTFVAAELKGRRWIGCEAGDCRPIVERFGRLQGEREHLADIGARGCVLFRAGGWPVRSKNGLPPDRH